MAVIREDGSLQAAQAVPAAEELVVAEAQDLICGMMGELSIPLTTDY